MNVLCQGVSCGDATSDCTPQKANCAIENVHLEWDFASKVWDATFVGGHAQGECLQFGPKDVTPALLKHLRSLELANGWYNRSSSSSNKSAAKEYILIWCKAVHDRRIAEHGAEFQSLLFRAPKTRDGANAASCASNDGTADDGGDPEGAGASEDEAPDAAAADVSAAGA